MEQCYREFMKNSSDDHVKDDLIGRVKDLKQYLMVAKVPYTQPYSLDFQKEAVR